MIEVSFVDGVMQLATGDVTVLKLLIAAVLTAYGMKIEYTKLQQAVLACPTQSANRPLMAEEEDLRNQWMQLIYYIAHTVEYRKVFVKDAQLLTVEEVPAVYPTILPTLQKDHAQGDSTAPPFAAQDFVQQHEHGLLQEFLSSASPLERALLLQNLRVAWMTLTVMEDERICYEEKGTSPPAPPIPNELAATSNAENDDSYQP